MTYSLTGNKISQTYQRLIQFVNGVYYDGLGNRLDFGPTGFQGSTGFQGVLGNTGPQGFQGLVGQTGFQGPSASMPSKYKWIGDGGTFSGVEIVNTYPNPISVSNPENGKYVFTTTGNSFQLNKTIVISTNCSGEKISASWEFISENEINVFMFDMNNNFTNPVKYQVIIETE